ncbi:MAG: hypothetical protein ABR567_14200 [Myxococcales bacterium]|nr:hypothetical protein [Myxococcales bacterium]
MRAFAIVLAISAPASAYNEAIHALITRTALPQREVLVQPPTQADLDAFRALVCKTCKDAWQLKEFLMLDPAARVHGFDLTPDDATPMTATELLARASRWPDDDERNRHRYLRDAKTHEIVKASDGSPMPYDPATLDFGSLTGTTSQGHAHYGLVDGPLSDDPSVLKTDPARFAVPPTAHAYGAEFAQLYTDLALIAANSGLPSAQWLTLTFEGAAFHHLEDLANQIHTVQVGIYEFFQSAFIQSKLQDVKTLGGLFGERKSLKQIGLRLIANHHLMSEDLFAKHVGTPQMPPDAGFDAISGPQFGLALAKALIAQSSREGPDVYRLAWHFSTPTLRDGVNGHEYDGDKGDDPDDFVDHSKRAEIDQFYALELRGVRRAANVLRAWQRRFDAEHERADPALLKRVAVERIDALLVPYHEQAAKRRASYRPARDERLGVAWGYPVAAAVLLATAFGLIWARLSKRS